MLRFVDWPDAGLDDYIKAVVVDNCLGKRSGKTRQLTINHLADLYALDTSTIVFRALLYFWNRDIDGQPLLALLCTYARDSVFRSTASFVLKIPEGSTITRESLEAFVDAQEPGRFSVATLKSTAQNINATWTQSGHLVGRSKKVRAQAQPTSGSVAYAFLLGYLNGVRGPALFRTEYARLLDCSADRMIELAEIASQRGWIVLKRVGDVIEVLFPKLLNQNEMEWLREQG